MAFGTMGLLLSSSAASPPPDPSDLRGQSRTHENDQQLSTPIGQPQEFGGPGALGAVLGEEEEGDYLDALCAAKNASDVDRVMVEHYRRHRAYMKAKAKERWRQKCSRRAQQRQFDGMRSILGMSSDSSGPVDSEDGGGRLAGRGQDGLLDDDKLDRQGDDKEEEEGKNEDSSEQDAFADDETFGLRFEPDKDKTYVVDQARDFSAPEVRGEVVEFINVSATAVSREDAKEIERLYPFEPGKRYFFPSRVAFVRERLRIEEAKAAAPDIRLFGKPASQVLPPFMQGETVTDEDVAQVQAFLYKPDGSVDVHRLRETLATQLENVSKVLNSILFEGESRGCNTGSGDGTDMPDVGGVTDAELELLQEQQDFLEQAVARVDEFLEEHGAQEHQALHKGTRKHQKDVEPAGTAHDCCGAGDGEGGSDSVILSSDNSDADGQTDQFDGGAGSGRRGQAVTYKGTFKAECRAGRMLTREHAWEDGYDNNQFEREWDLETGEFVDGHVDEWLPPAQNALFQAARHGEKSIERLADLLRQGAIVNAYCPSTNCATALHWAAWRGHHKTCQALLELGANVSARMSCGATALHMSAFLGHLKVSRLLVENGCDPWHRRRIDGLTALDLALRVTNPAGDRSRVIAYLRDAMNLSSVVYHSLWPQVPWAPIQDILAKESHRDDAPARVGGGEARADEEHQQDSSFPPDSHDMWGKEHGCGVTVIESEEDSDPAEQDGEFEWQGPPGNVWFPELTPDFPKGRWVRTIKAAVRANRSEANTSRPDSSTRAANVSAPEGNLSKVPHQEIDPSEIFVTLPPGPYVPWWKTEKILEQLRRQNEHPGGPEGGAEQYANVRDYFAAQKEEEAAEVQRQAEAEYQGEFNVTIASASHTYDPHRVEDAQEWTERDVRGSGAEYGKTSMQSRSMRRLGLHQKGQFR